MDAQEARTLKESIVELLAPIPKRKAQEGVDEADEAPFADGMQADNLSRTPQTDKTPLMPTSGREKQSPGSVPPPPPPPPGSKKTPKASPPPLPPPPPGARARLVAPGTKKPPVLDLVARSGVETGGPLIDPGPAPGCKLRSFFWDKLPDSRVPGTFWASHIAAYDFLDLSSLEREFSAVQARASGGTHSSPTSPPSSKSNLVVLDLKHATAIGIRMARLKVGWRDAPAAAARYDVRLLQSTEDIDALLDCIPTQDQATALEAYVAGAGPSALSTLADAEGLALELGRVPRLAARLHAAAAALKAPETLADAQRVVTAHIAAARELKESEAFSDVLTTVLALGNVLNHGGRLGAAPGFRLRALSKLHNTRASDGRATLLSWLVARWREIHHAATVVANGTRSPDTLSPHVLPPSKTNAEKLQTSHTPRASRDAKGTLIPTLCGALPCLVSPLLRVSLAETSEQLNALDRSLHAARTEVQRAKQTPGEASKAFLTAVGERVTQLSEALLGAQTDLEAAREEVAATAAYFGENVAAIKQSEQEFWADLQSFLNAFAEQERLQAGQGRNSTEPVKSVGTPR